MTLNDIELASYRRTGYADTPAVEVTTRMRQWINIWHQRLLARPGIELLRDATTFFPSVANQPTYVLPAGVRRIKKILERDTPTALRMESHGWVREIDPGDTAIGTPEVWAPITWGVTTPPLAQITIRLWPTPQGVTNYIVDAQGTAADLAAATDVPLLPYEYHWLLVEAACYEEWMRKADTRSGSARQDLETGFKEMRHWLANPRDYMPTNAPSAQSSSRLGGMYPSW